MLTIPGHKGNEIQTHIKIHLTPVRVAIMKNTKKQLMLQKMWEKESSYIVGRNAN
jgi:hypothetical protein